jgi:hypothetical protein
MKANENAQVRVLAISRQLLTAADIVATAFALGPNDIQRLLASGMREAHKFALQQDEPDDEADLFAPFVMDAMVEVAATAMVREAVTSTRAPGGLFAAVWAQLRAAFGWTFS